MGTGIFDIQVVLDYNPYERERLKNNYNFATRFVPWKGMAVTMKYGLSETTYNKIKALVEKYNKYSFKIFGSRARNEYKKQSDIDIAIYGDVTKFDEFNILNDFDELDIPYMVDIVFMYKLEKKELIESITMDGKDF